MNITRHLLLLLLITSLLAGCGFTLKKPAVLAPSLHQLYLKTPDPYGQLERDLREYLKMSHVHLVSSEQAAQVVLEILHEDVSQQLLSVSSTQQTRQYTLFYKVTFQLTNNKGLVIYSPQTITETSTLTVQSNQILASGSETSLLYQVMRKAAASDIMNRLAAKEITTTVNKMSKQPQTTP